MLAPDRAGRGMSRAEAKRKTTLAEHKAATEVVDAVMAARADLVRVVHTLRQVVCVRGAL